MPCTALSMSQPVGLPTPAYTCLHQPACLPAGHLQNLNPPHLPSPTALASRHHQILPSCPAMYRPACPCPHLPAYTSLTTSACLPTPARPLPYLPPSYQLPTLSILPSCAMACSESVPPTHQQHTSKCQGALPACCQASLYDHKYTEGDCTCILYLKRLTIGHGPIFDPPSFLMLRCCKF